MFVEPMETVLTAAPVPKLIVSALASVPISKLPVVPESIVRAVAAPELTVPAPANVMAVAEVAIVSIEATPVRAPAVETFNPPLLVKANVPVELPIATVPVPVVPIVTFEAPDVAKSVAPVELKVVNAPVDAAELPIGVPLIEVNPVAIAPADKVPTLVREDARTFEASVAPVISAAAFMVTVLFGKVMTLSAVGLVIAKVVSNASAEEPSNTNGDAPAKTALPTSTIPEVAVILNAPVVSVIPFEAVNTPADVTVPVPVEEIFAEVVISLAVEMEPNPLAIDPEERAPTAVKEEVTTLEANVVPEILAAALTVMDAFGKVIVLLETVGSVMAKIVLTALAVAPSNTNGDAPANVALPMSTVPEVAVTLNAPVVSVSPFEAVSV